MHSQSVMSILLLVALPQSLPAGGHEDEARALFDALQIPQTIEILRQEGLAYGDQIATDLFPGPAPAEWSGLVDDIYDSERLETALFEQFVTQIEGEDIAAITAFYSSDLGQSAITLEVTARAARLDEEVERASLESAALAAADEEPRFMRIAEYVDDADLLNTNVVAAMNFNYAFYLGLVEGGALGSVSEDDILADVWAQEPDIRSQTREWMYSYLYMAYEPISDEDLDAYLNYQLTDGGMAVNQALIAAFDPVYTDLSRALGLAAAQMMTQHEL